MNFYGVILGALSFLIIGSWHPIVIKGEYYFGKKICIAVFGLIGAVCTFLSLRIPRKLLSAALALFGFSAFWGAKEVVDQEERVKKGWFPENPKRKGKQ